MICLFSVYLTTLVGLKSYLDINIVAGSFLVLREPQLLNTDAVVNDDWVGRVEQRVQPLRYLGKLHSLRLEDLLEKGVAVDKLALVGVLQLVGLDVLPEGGDDDGPGLCMNPEQPGQALVQLELQRLVVEQQQNCASHIFIARSLYLTLFYSLLNI